MSFLRDEEAGMMEQIEAMAMIPLLTVSGSAPVLHDSRDSLEVLEEALSEPGPSSGLFAASFATAAGDGSSAPAEPADGRDAPEDWRTRGLLDTVSPDNDDDILRLCGRVDTRLHEAARAQDLAALRALLAAGAAPAALDWAGRTPLHACVADRLIEPLKVLLSVPGSADVCDASGWPLLHAALLHGWQDGACAILDAGASVTPECEKNPKDFQSALNRYPRIKKDEFSFSFMKLPIDIAIESYDMYMFEAILTVAKRENVLESLNGFGVTALGTAISKSNLPAIQALLTSGASRSKVSDRNQTVLHAAVHDPNILKYLLENTDVKSTLDNNGLAPVHEAVRKNHPESIRILLNKFKNARLKTEPEEYTPLHIAAHKINNAAAKVILEYDLAAMNEVNEQGDTPLHTAAKYNNWFLAAALLLNGATLSTKNKKGTTVLELISTSFYDPSTFFDRVLDQFIVPKTTGDKFNFSVDVEYKVLTDGEEMSQINVLEEFVRCGRGKSLLHPLVESLLILKWRQFQFLFFAMILVYVIFLGSFNSLMIRMFYVEDVNSTMTNSSNLNTTLTSVEGEEPPGSSGFHGGVIVLSLLTYICIIILLWQESCFIYVKKLRYFASFESWVKLSGLVLCALAPPLAASAQGPWPRHVACAALLLAWLQAMFLVSRFPHWGYYVLMFGKVAVTMLKLLVTSIFLVIGFAFCFMIHFQSAPPFDGPFPAFVKTLVMMSSEFDYEDLFGEDHDKQLQDTRTIVLLLFVMFVIFVAIVLMNFMIGVAVSDINDLNETGNIRRLEKQVELLSTFDALVQYGVLAKWFKNSLGAIRYHTTLSTVIGSRTTWYTKYRQYPYTKEQDDHGYHIEIHSSTLYSTIVTIAGRNINREKSTKTNHDFTHKINTLFEAIVGKPVPTCEEGEDDKQKQKYGVTIRKVLAKQQNQIKYTLDGLSRMSHEIAILKRSNEGLNSRISELSSLSADILKSMKEMTAKSANTRFHGGQGFHRPERIRLHQAPGGVSGTSVQDTPGTETK